MTEIRSAKTRLLVDLGSSQVKWAWAQGTELDRASSRRGDLAEFDRSVKAGNRRPDAVLVASVAGGERTAQLARSCEAHWGLIPEWMESRLEENGLRNAYEDATRLGVDRWLAMLAAVRLHGAPVIVWDLGTATTLDAVDASGRHLGGWILPGPGTMLGALGAGTRLAVPGQLPAYSSEPEPARNTADAIAGGVVAAQLGALDRFRAAVTPRMSGPPAVVATGGACWELAPLCPDAVVEPCLVFLGMVFREAESASNS